MSAQTTETSIFQGPSESILGQRGLASEFTIDTKAATGMSAGSGRKILESAKDSLEALQTTKVRSLTTLPDPIYFY
jgi:aflatoxin B1 aldehyde reductase